MRLLPCVSRLSLDLKTAAVSSATLNRETKGAVLAADVDTLVDGGDDDDDVVEAPHIISSKHAEFSLSQISKMTYMKYEKRRGARSAP